MKLIESSVEILEQSSGLDGIYEQIEIAGRTCYKSEPKYRYWNKDRNRWLNGNTEDFKMWYSEKEFPIKENISAKDFVDRMIKPGHGAMLEHGTVYLKVNAFNNEIAYRYKNNKYSKVNSIGIGESEMYYITTNYRVIIENNWLNDLKWFITEPTEHHEKRISVKFIMDRIGSQSFCRHRVFSFAQESTRYCNYSKDKFGNELTFIIPSTDTTYELNPNISYNYILSTELSSKFIFESIFYGVRELDIESKYYDFIKSLCIAETTYINMIKNGFKPQEARAVLPNALKTEIVMTGFESDWEGFFKLRCNKAAHPDAQVLANKLKELM